MSKNHGGKGILRDGGQDIRRHYNEKRDAESSEQSRNYKRHLQEGRRQSEIEFATKWPPEDLNSK